MIAFFILLFIPRISQLGLDATDSRVRSYLTNHSCPTSKDRAVLPLLQCGVLLDGPEGPIVGRIQRRSRIIAPPDIGVIGYARLNLPWLVEHRAVGQSPSIERADIICRARAGKPCDHIACAIHCQRREIIPPGISCADGTAASPNLPNQLAKTLTAQEQHQR